MTIAAHGHSHTVGECLDTIINTSTHAHTHARTHTHTHTFNGPFSGTTWVSRYLKGQINLDFNEARDSERQWHQLCHMQGCTLLQTDNHARTPSLSFYRPDTLPAAQPTASKHWRQNAYIGLQYISQPFSSHAETEVWNMTSCYSNPLSLYQHSTFSRSPQQFKFAFSALTPFIGRQEEHPACRNWVMGCWCGYLSGTRCRLFACGPADATACIPEPRHLLPRVNPDWFYLSGTSLPRLSWKIAVKRV